jgi:glycosyltransferase involved in cell wall biosynthesis
MKTRIAIAYGFNDSEWMGGRNYFGSLLRALDLIKDHSLQIVFVTGKKTQTSIPSEFKSMEVHQTSLLDKWCPLWILRRLTISLFHSDPFFSWYLRKLNIQMLSHSGNLGKNPGFKVAPWLFDFQFMHLPGNWTKRQLRRVARNYADACKQGDAIIVSSEDAKKDLQTFLPKLTTPIHVLRFVSNPVVFSEFTEFSVLKNQYNLPANYLFLPNQFWTHKNHGIVIRALRVLKDRGVRAKVVCTGSTKDPRAPNYFENLMSDSKSLGIADSFIVLGVIPYVDMQALMASSIAVINPSHFEGWSTTVEEAKTLKKRLILSNIRVHTEQASGYGLFFEPDDASALADLMQACIETPETLVALGDISASYTRRLEKFAAEYLKIVSEVLT